MITLAHFSDPHLGPLPPPGAGRLLNKRLLGYLSWTWRRHAIHQQAVLSALADDVIAEQPDHVAITGDLVNISLPEEFAAAAAWLQHLGAPDWISVIPGNHDAYVTVPWQASLGRWAEYMSNEWQDGNDVALPAGFEDFPYVRRRAPLALIGLSSAQPTAPFSAAGRLGRRQLEALRERLRRLGRDGLFRVVLLHHPPLATQTARRKSLIDGAAFQAVIAEAGAELVLHGHVHRFSSGRIATASGFAPVIGVPSASSASGDRLAHYHLYRISRDGDAWRLEVTARGFSAAKGRFLPGATYSLAVPR